MFAAQVFEMFNVINAHCEITGENVVPMTQDNTDYYRDQMTLLEIDQLVQDEVIACFEVCHAN